MTAKPKHEKAEEPKQAERFQPKPAKVIMTGPDQPLSVYSNHVELNISNWDFKFRFGEILDQQGETIHITERVRVIMSPQHTKAFLLVLAQNVQKFEATFGEIRLVGTSAKEDPSPQKPQ